MLLNIKIPFLTGRRKGLSFVLYFCEPGKWDEIPMYINILME
jgi:hypothetical protein